MIMNLKVNTNYGNSAKGLSRMKHNSNWFKVPLYKVLCGLDKGNIYLHCVSGNFTNNKMQSNLNSIGLRLVPWIGPKLISDY